MNPMLQFAKRLASKGVQITFATTLSTAKKIQLNAHTGGAFNSIAVESVHDDTDEANLGLNWSAKMASMQANVTENLGRLIAAGKLDHRRVALVYDANLSWAVAVAKDHGVPAAAFFTQACATVASYYRLYLEWRGEEPPAGFPPAPAELPAPRVLEEGISNLGGLLPPGGKEKFHPIIVMVLEQLKELHRADWVLFNSFFKLEEQVMKWMENLWPVKTIGPTIPSVYLDKRVENDVNYGFNLFKLDNDACMNWLNTKEPNSVVYVSFGSAAYLSREKMREIAEALKQIPSRFLWVVRETEQKTLPENFISELSPEKGLVISWCPQLDVLAHEAVGCFVSHCGWNSTVEALSFGVPVLAMPQFLDQMIDAHYIEHVWGVGLRPKADEKGMVTREEIGRCLEELMNGERAEKIKENAAMWKAMAKEAVDEGGSSDKTIDEIIAKLASL